MVITTEARSALANLTIPAATLSSDPLVALIAAISPPYQTNVNIVKKGGSLTLKIGPDTLTYRNAILRSLCGNGLHNALDSQGNSPLLFLGGHSASSFAGSSPISALAIAGITSWMSVASSIRDGSPDDVSTLIGQLNGYFVTRGFVVPSAAPTLADLDLYLAIVTKVSGDELESMVGSNVNTRRWLEQCGATIDELVAMAAKNTKIPAITIPKGLTAKPRALPNFFFGDEDEATVAAAASAVKSATSTTSAGNKGKGGAPTTGGAGLTDEQKKAAAEKKAKKNAEKAAKKKKDGGGKGGGATPAAELNVSALDIRVGKIVKAWNHEESDKLYCEEVDVGEETPRKIASGLRSFYKLDEMQERNVLVLCNLKARNLGGFPSHGMVLCASNADHTKVEFAVPPEGSKIGERVMFEGFTGDPEPENKVAKKKIFDKLAPDLKTDRSGEVVWKGVKGKTSAGVCKAVNGMTEAQVS